MKINNADRFWGFANIYEKARPRVPEYPADVLCRYLGAEPQVVIDLGCGTGLSSEIWQKYSKKVIGIEPSDDMLALAKTKSNNILEFQQGTGENTGLPDACADIVICSQSFHWMEPTATLKEINRVLKSNGVFATVDCDWPAVTKWQAEKTYMELYNKVKEIESSVPEIRETFIRYPKEHHLKNITESGYFTYTRELLFSNAEPCTKERYKQIILSQGSLQTIIKKRPDLISDDIEKFNSAIDNIFDTEEFQIEFSYRMRIGIKSSK